MAIPVPLWSMIAFGLGRSLIPAVGMQNDGKLSSDCNFGFAQPAALRKPDADFVTLLSLSAVICGRKGPSCPRSVTPDIPSRP
jgi:hypothetical protein